MGFDFYAFAVRWGPPVLFVEGVLAIGGVIVAIAVYARRRWPRRVDRLAVLNHLLPPIRVPHYLMTGWRWVLGVIFLACWPISLALVIANPILSGLTHVGVLPNGGWVTAVFLTSQVAFGLSVVSAILLRPFIRVLLRIRTRNEAEAGFINGW
jgi:hypothetical protein